MDFRNVSEKNDQENRNKIQRKKGESINRVTHVTL